MVECKLGWIQVAGLVDDRTLVLRDGTNGVIVCVDRDRRVEDGWHRGADQCLLKEIGGNLLAWIPLEWYVLSGHGKAITAYAGMKRR